MRSSTLIKHYKKNKRPSSQKELNWFKSQPSLERAVEIAVSATNDRGKRYSHQCKIPKAALVQAKPVLMAMVNDFRQCESFDQVFDLVRELRKIQGIGELYVYDTALRIGAYLGLLPEKVYLHAGTRVGAKELGFDSKRKTIEMNELPPEFQELQPLEVEDVFCIYKTSLS